ncbi:MAG: MATE family efflux transporter [Candidatus Avoscillospira sp.]
MHAEKIRPFSNRALIQLLIPLVIEQFLAVAVGLADSLMVASVGEAAVSSVSLVDTVNVLLVNTFSALATGGAIVTGQYLGNRAMDDAQRSAEQLLIFMGVLSLVVTAAMYALRYFIIHVLFGAVDPEVAADAEIYFNIVELSIPFLAIYSAGAALFRVMGDSKTSMRISLYMNLINVLGNALLIFGFHWRVAGVAVPTLASRVFAAAAVLLLLRNEKLPIRLSRRFRLFYDAKAIRNIVRTGVPNGIEGSLFQLGKILLLSVVSGFGTASITANAIGNTIGSFQVLAGNAIGMGLITVVSQCVGRQDYDDVDYYTKKLLIFTYLALWVTNIAILAATPLILRVYNVSPEAQDLASKIIWMHGVMGMIFWPMSFTFPQTLRAAGDTRFAMIAAVVSMWLFRLVLGALLATRGGYGVLGIWMAMFVDWFVRIACFVWRYRSGKWKKMAVPQ